MRAEFQEQKWNTIQGLKFLLTKGGILIVKSFRKYWIGQRMNQLNFQDSFQAINEYHIKNIYLYSIVLNGSAGRPCYTDMWFHHDFAFS